MATITALLEQERNARTAINAAKSEVARAQYEREKTIAQLVEHLAQTGNLHMLTVKPEALRILQQDASCAVGSQTAG